MPLLSFLRDVKEAVDSTLKDAANDLRNLSYSMQSYQALLADSLLPHKPHLARIDYFPLVTEEEVTVTSPKPALPSPSSPSPAPAPHALSPQVITENCLVVRVNTPERLAALQQHVKRFEASRGIDQWPHTSDTILPKTQDDPAEKLAALIADKASRDLEMTKAFFHKVFSR